MRASELSELAAFVAVARLKNFSKAAEERGVTPSAISHAVSNLEARVELRLLNRSTRSVSLTDAGALLRSQLEPAFADISHAMDTLNNYRDTPFGNVKINVPSSIAPYVIGPVIGPLLTANPHLDLQIVATDSLVDIVRAGFDAGIRLGESLSEGMVAAKIQPRMEFAVVGSPTYFARHGVPETPNDLNFHTCIQNMYPSGVRYSWDFKREDAQVSYHPSGPLALDDHELMVQAAVSGVSLAYVWKKRAQQELDRGNLVECLQDWMDVGEWLYLYYPSRKHVSAGLRALIDALKAG
jgi:DNA-binding transcriptional LysR family regulator